MKRILFLNIFLIGLIFASCEPNATIYEELDKSIAEEDALFQYNIGKAVAPSSYTLTDDDYALSSNEDVAKYKNFSDNALPKDFLPEILNSKFTAEDGFEMAVTYNFYQKVVADEQNAYELSDEDYAFLGESYTNFSDEEKAEALIANLLNLRTYNAEAGDESTVQYTFYASNMTRYIRVNADYSTEVLDYSDDAYELTDADYESLGQGRYLNFTYISDAEDGMVEFAKAQSHTLPKEYAVKVYRNYIDTYVVYYFDGSSWSVKQSVMPVTEPLNFALNTENLNASTWWADPALKITLGEADYNLFDETRKYQNFDLRGSVAPGTDRAKLVEMIGVMLDTNHAPVDGQQYLVTYAYYDGSNGTDVVRIIRTAGTWAEYSE